MRDMVSGRDFQLRYALHRLTLLAIGADPLHARVARLRLEWPLGSVWADVVLQEEDGRIVEIVECKEHQNHIAIKSLRTFFADVRKTAVLVPDARFRFATNARHLPNGKAPSAWRAPPIDPSRITWEVDVPNKDSLAAECIAYFARGSRDPFVVYAKLYARLAAQAAARLQRDGTVFVNAVKDLHAWLFSDIDPNRLSADLSIAGEESFAIDELRSILRQGRPRQRALDTARIVAMRSVATGILSDSMVTLEQVFIDPSANTVVHHSEVDRTRSVESTLSLLFEWLATKRAHGAGRLAGVHGADVPLLLLGDFGFGKTSVLATFAYRLLDHDPTIWPIFVRLRNLKAAGTSIPLLEALRKHVRGSHGIDIDETEDEICLLCDGFDELNLFYTQSDQHQWVEEGYRQLSSLAQRANVTVIISSRPILFVSSEAALRDGATRIHLREFDDARIRRWCERYRESASLAPEFSFEFLDERDLVEVARTPIVLYMIARIFETQRDLLEAKRYTRAEIYRLFITWTERGRYHTDEEKHALPANYREILQEIAWLLFQSGKGAVAAGELLEGLRATFGATVDRIPIDRNILVAHMLRTSGDVSDAGDVIEFTHQSFREYLVAERIWRLLGPIRAGEPLQAATWIALAGRVLTDAKVSLLREMVATLPEAEAKALYEGLDGADNIHNYWAKWSQPMWARLEGEELRGWFATLPSRAAGMAVLAFVLRVAAYQRCGEAMELAPPRSETLRRLILFLQAFPEAGVAAEAETLLLQNLQGLRLEEGSSLRGVELSGTDISECRLRGIGFEGALLAGLVATDGTFIDCSFSRTMFDLTAYGATFDDCDFTSARLILGWPEEPSDLRFTNCRFDDAVFETLTLRGPSFTGCTFEGARVAIVGNPAVLIEATLDAAARRYFQEAGVRLVRSR